MTFSELRTPSWWSRTAQQQLYLLRILRKNDLFKKLLVFFYCCSVKSMLLLHLCLVRQLQFSWQVSAPKGHFYCPENYRLPTSFLWGQLQLLKTQQSHQFRQRLVSPLPVQRVALWKVQDVQHIINKIKVSIPEPLFRSTLPNLKYTIILLQPHLFAY